LTASRAIRRSTAAGLSAADLAWAARSSWAFFAFAAALRRSAKLAFLDQFISVFYAQENGSSPKGSKVSDRRSPRHIPGMDETKIEKLARLSGRVSSKVVGALERRGYDIRGKMSAPINRVPRRVLQSQSRMDELQSDWLGRLIATAPLGRMAGA
jgi:hypothetical protein